MSNESNITSVSRHIDIYNSFEILGSFGYSLILFLDREVRL